MPSYGAEASSATVSSKTEVTGGDTTSPRATVGEPQLAQKASSPSATDETTANEHGHGEPCSSQQCLLEKYSEMKTDGGGNDYHSECPKRTRDEGAQQMALALNQVEDESSGQGQDNCPSMKRARNGTISSTIETAQITRIGAPEPAMVVQQA